MTEFSLTTYAAIAKRIDAIEFHHPFILTATGEVRDAEGYYASDVYAPDVYAPDVYDAHDTPFDVTVVGDWESVTYGLSGQYAYRGCIMHPAEFIGTKIARHLMKMVELHDDTDQVFAVVTVEGGATEADDDGLVGWTIVRYTGKDA